MSTKTKRTTVAETIRETLIHSMKKDKNIILFGEGIDDGAAMFKTTKGLTKIFGPKRVFEMPLSENLFVGAAIGASMLGDKVIINLQRVEFALLALEQIINNAAKTFYASNGKHNVPIVIRLVVGRGWGQGPAHGQSLETLFSSIPGLKVFMPCFPEETKNLLFEAINDPNPVIFIENRWCHYNFGKTKKKFKKKNPSIIKLSSGKDLAIVSTGYNTSIVQGVTKILKKFNISVEHFHISKLKPLNINKLIRPIKKIKKYILLDNGVKEFGFFAEVNSLLNEKLNGIRLKQIRLGLPDHPIPSSRGLVKNVYINGSTLIKNCIKLLNINKATGNKILREYSKIEKSSSVDTPNENFKGPF